MRKYPAENWKALGIWVHDARMQGDEEQRDWSTWPALVGRSERVLRGLERGEPQGEKSLEAVADALGIERWWIFAKLADPKLSSLELSSADVRRLKDETGYDSADTEVSLGLARYTDDEIVGEVRQRMRGAATTLSVVPDPEPQPGGPNPDALASELGLTDDKIAARKGKSEGRARRQAEDDEMIRPDDPGPEFGA